MPYITSFTRQADALGQWRGYCPDGGYSIGFDGHKLLKQIKSLGGRMLNCLYDEEIQWHFFEDKWMDSLDLRRASGNLNELYDIKEKVHSFISSVAFFGSYFKHPAWQEEQECRAVIYPKETEAKWTIKYRGKTADIPYVEIPIKTEFINEIIVGPRTNYKLAKELIHKLLPHLETEQIKKSQVPLR